MEAWLYLIRRREHRERREAMVMQGVAMGLLDKAKVQQFLAEGDNE